MKRTGSIGSIVGPAVIENAFALEILRDSQRLQHGFDDLFGLGEPPRADHSAGQIAASGLDDANPATTQDVEVPLRRLVLPHVYVHRRRHDYRSRGCQIQGGQKVCGGAVGELGQRVGRCRCHQQCVDRLRHADVLDRGAGIRLRCTVGEHFGDDVLARQSREGQRTHELLRRARHYHLHLDAAIL